MAHSTENTASLPAHKGWLGILLALSLGLLSTANHAQTQSAPETNAPTAREATEAEAIDMPPPIPEPPIYQNREERDMKLLAARQRPDSVVWLDALEEQFLALYEREFTGSPLGAILLLHAEGQHSSWPQTIQMIRSSLPKYGWNTLSMSLPNPQAIPHPKRDEPAPVQQPDTSNETEGEGPDDAESVADSEDESSPVKATSGEEEEIYDAGQNGLSDGSIPEQIPSNAAASVAELAIPVEDRSLARIQAALSYLHDRGQFNIVLLGDGVGAARAGYFFTQLPSPKTPKEGQKAIKPIRAVVILNARNHTPIGDLDLLGSLFDPEVPTLDIYFGQDRRNSMEAELRKQYTQRQQFQVYKQIRLPAMSNVSQQGENRLSRRIRGFLQEHARGVEVKNAIVNKQ